MAIVTTERRGGSRAPVRRLGARAAAFVAATIVLASLLAPTSALAAARSVRVVVRNDTGFNLYRERAHLDHGVWGTRTPGIIGDYGEWSSESDGFLTGTEGWATYRIVDLDNNVRGTVTVTWDNPYAGSNSYSESVTPAGSADGSGFSVGHYGGGGDDARVTFRLLTGRCQIDPDSGEPACTSAAGLDLPPGTCVQGYVWREAFPGDHVCVTPDIRTQAATDNAQAGARRQPGGGAYGPDTCRQGFVWREASPSDHVCVTPATRARAADDNSQAPYRVVN